MTTGELLLTVPTLVVCFIAFVWFLLNERKQRKRAEGMAPGENPPPALKPLDDYFSKTIYSRVGSGKDRKNP
jgi:hypothetical protein